MIWLHRDCGHHWIADAAPKRCPACDKPGGIVETDLAVLPVAEPIFQTPPTN